MAETTTLNDTQLNASRGLARALHILTELGEQPLRAVLLVLIPDNGEGQCHLAYGGEALLAAETAIDELNEVVAREKAVAR